MSSAMLISTLGFLMLAVSGSEGRDLLKRQATTCTYPKVVSADSKFITNVNAALYLLCKKAPQYLNWFPSYMKRIEENPRSGMLAYKDPPTFQMSSTSASAGEYWVASIIAHDTYHSYLYHDYKTRYPGRAVPDSVWTGIEAEKKCNAFQMTVLKAIGAPSKLIDYMKTLDGTHCDTNRDGVCDDRDYALRPY